MKGNEKVGITAGFAAIIKSQENRDYNYFVSVSAKRWFKFFNFLFPKSVQSIFNSRLKLSKGFNRIIFAKTPETLVNLGAGFSLVGFNLSNKINYVELDFPSMVDYKKRILLKMCKDKGIGFPKNYKMIKADLLNKFEVPLKGKSVFFAEGVASYLNQNEFDRFIENTRDAMDMNSVFYYNERWGRRKDFVYQIFRGFISLLSRSKSNLHFLSKREAKSYFKNKGFSKIKFFKREGFEFIELKK